MINDAFDSKFLRIFNDSVATLRRCLMLTAQLPVQSNSNHGDEGVTAHRRLTSIKMSGSIPSGMDKRTTLLGSQLADSSPLLRLSNASLQPIWTANKDVHIHLVNLKMGEGPDSETWLKDNSKNNGQRPNHVHFLIVVWQQSKVRDPISNWEYAQHPWRRSQRWERNVGTFTLQNAILLRKT